MSMYWVKTPYQDAESVGKEFERTLDKLNYEIVRVAENYGSIKCSDGVISVKVDEIEKAKDCARKMHELGMKYSTDHCEVDVTISKQPECLQCGFLGGFSDIYCSQCGSELEPVQDIGF